MNDEGGSGIRVLLGDLDKDLRILEGLVAENERAMARIEAGAKDRFDYVVLAYTIHNIYCLMENYFLRVAKTFENHVEGDAWHRDLVRRMSIAVEGIRPALLDDETALAIDELRAFRHVFRNVYMSPLIPRKVLEVQGILRATLDAFEARSAEFIAKLRLMLDED
jgi:hypothetical protein